MSESFDSPLLLKYIKEFEANPNSRVFAPLSEAYRKVGMVKEAIQVLSRGMKVHPDYIPAHQSLAACYFDLGENHLAYKTLHPYVVGTRDNIKLQRLYIDICLKIGKDDEALENLKYLSFINPKDEDTLRKIEELEAKRYSNEDTLEFTFEGDESSSDMPEIPIDDDQWEEYSADSLEEGEDEDEEFEVGQDVETISLSDFEINDENSKSDVQEIEISENESPVITHTIVDLYCSQGHHEKALKILHKILDLNPGDEKTLEKIESVKLRMTNGFSDKLENSSDGKKLEEKLELFLSKIKSKAHQKQSSLHK